MDTEIGLRELLSKETKRQKRSYRRATMLMALIALIGAAWLAFSAINVIRLERKAKALKADSTELQLRSTELQRRIDSQTKELEGKTAELATADKTLLNVQTKLKENNPKAALQVVSEAINVRKPTPNSTPTPRPSPQDQIITIRFRGSSSLDYIERHIDLYQFEHGAVLVSLSAEPGGVDNTASFTIVDIGSRIPKITLIALPQGREQVAIKAQLEQGKKLIRQTSIFVNGKLTKIAAFKQVMSFNQ